MTATRSPVAYLTAEDIEQRDLRARTTSTIVAGPTADSLAVATRSTEPAASKG